MAYRELAFIVIKVWFLTIYSTSLIVGVCSVITQADRISPLYLHNAAVYVWINAVLTVSILAGIHLYLSRNYVTLEIPPT